MSFRHPARLPLAGIVSLLAFAACDRPITQPDPDPATPVFSSAGGNRFDEFTPLPTEAACVTPPATLAGFTAYQPFVLPQGFTQAILADEQTDFLPVAGTGANLPDMLTLNETGPEAGRYLYRTHEVGSNGAVTVTDLVTGATSLIDQASHYEALDGIVWTPWGTLLFAEERITAALKDPRVPNAVGGLVYEWSPATLTSVPLPAVGARSHEGLRFDPQGNLYGISESTPGINGSGGLYKFVPDTRGDLSSGQLYALRVIDPSRTGPAVWVPLDRAAVAVNSDAAAIAAGATGWGRPEDIEITPSGVMYVAVTSEDLVLRVELDGDRAFVSNYIANVPGFEDPDNLALDAYGNLFVAEDRSAGDLWMASRGHPGARVASRVVRFASLTDCAAEPTGIYFDRNGQTLWVNVQHAGGPLANDLTIAIRK